MSWSRMISASARAATCLLLIGCTSDDGTTGVPPPPPTGSATITIATSGVRIDPDGYELTVGQVTRSVEPNEIVQFLNLPVGAHAVTVSGLSLNCAESDPPLTSVTVQAGATVQAALEIECGHLVFVANLSSDDISVISTVTQSVVATIDLEGVSSGLAITPDGERLYFGNLFRPVLHKIDAVSTTTFEIVAEVPVALGVFEIVISADGALGYAAQPFDDQVEVFDVLGNAILAQVHLSTFPTDLVLTADGQWAYVAVHGGDHLAELDLVTDQRRRFYILDAPFAVALSSDESSIYVSRWGFEDVLALTRSNFGIRSQASLGFRAMDLLVSPDGERLYAGGSQWISVRDAVTLDEITVIPVGGVRLAITADGALLYGTDTGNNRVTAISTANHTVLAQIPVGDSPRGVAITPP